MIDAGQNTKTMIVGMGKTGASCARFLANHHLSFAFADTREIPPYYDELKDEYRNASFMRGEFSLNQFDGFRQIILSPGVPLKTPAIQNAIAQGAEVIGDIELFVRQVKAPVMAITGSNGKSTVTSLFGEMAHLAGIKVAVGGNLGKAALDLLDDVNELYVIEISSFQLETTTSLKATAAVVLNLSEDHQDRYANYQEYIDAKARIYKNAQTCIVNLDDELASGLARKCRHKIAFSLSKPKGDHYGIIKEKNKSWLGRGDQKLLDVRKIKIDGRHNQANALAALALGEAIGLESEPMLKAIKEFSGLAHRTQFIAEADGVRWYNDSKATNIGACISALEGLDKADGSKAVLIAGGDCKGASFEKLRRPLKDYVRALILIGRDAQIIAEAVSEATQIYFAEEGLEQAVQMAELLANPGDHVLLSPACASFDMFRDYRHRGEVFMHLVKEELS